MQLPRYFFRASLAGLILGLSACGGAGSPRGAADELASALREGDHARAYGLLSERDRSRISYQDFAARMDAHPDEARVLAAELERAEMTEPIHATATLSDGSEVPLIYEDGRWWLAANIVDFYAQGSPRVALRSFLRAVERERYDILPRFIPEADRAGLDEASLREMFEAPERQEEMAQMFTAVRENLEAPIEQTGRRAVLSYGSGQSVRFLFEDGVWKIEDLD